MPDRPRPVLAASESNTVGGWQADDPGAKREGLRGAKPGQRRTAGDEQRMGLLRMPQDRRSQGSPCQRTEEGEIVAGRRQFDGFLRDIQAVR